MTRIQRQYSLPNCTLILDGMDDPTQANPMDLRPVMTMLLNAECHLGTGIGGGSGPIAGGREFFESLVTAVSLYAQEFLSKIHLPKHVYSDKPAMVQMKRLGDNLHELSYQRSVDSSQSSTQIPKSETLNLTTVQLFDLVEAIDQFVADTQTLPFWSLNLAPVPKKFAPTAALGKQAIPAAIGLSGLALTALGLFMLPIPNVKQPDDLRPGTPNAAVPAPVASASPSASSSPSADTQKIQNDLSAVAPIQDPAEILRLQTGLGDKLSAQFKPSGKLTGPIEYRVSVGKDGTIVGFQPKDDLARVATGETPLPGLLMVPTADKKPEAIADYRVVFSPDGKVEVQPWTQTAAAGSPTVDPAANPTASPSPTTSPTIASSPIASSPIATPSAEPTPVASPSASPTIGATAVNPSATSAAPGQGSEITESATIDALQPNLYEQIDRAWRKSPTFNEDLKYRVRIGKDGTVVSYEADNRAARDYENDTPLPTLPKAKDSNAGAASFKVVFKPSGRLEINPWYGYSKP